MPPTIDIDEIVREVLARLRSDVANHREPVTAGSVKPTQTSNAPTTAPDTLELADRLVTLATLENRLTNIRHLVLRPGTVVTPSARDALRARQVSISFVASAAAAVATTLLLGVADIDASQNKFNVGSFVAALAADRIHVERLAATGLTSVVSELADHAARGGRPALLLTCRTEAAVCLANRTRGVRAVGGRNGTELRRAITDVAANFVALDPALGPAAMRQIVREFCGSWPRKVPAYLT